MAGNVSGLHRFADDTGPIPLSLLDNNYDALTVALNTLSTFNNFFVDAGATNALTITTPSTQFVSYTDGLAVTVRVANSNTGPATFNINGLGPRQILNVNGSVLSAGEMLAGQIVTLTYNAPANAWQLDGGGVAGGGGGGGIVGGVVTGPVTITPGTGTMLTLDGAPNNTVLNVGGAHNTISSPASWLAQFAYTPAQDAGVGASNGVMISAGTNASDVTFTTDNVYGTGPSIMIRGDGSGSIGLPPNSLSWNAQGQWTLPPTFPGGGGGTLPGGPPYHFLGPVTVDPGTGTMLTLNGAVNANTLDVGGASNTQTNWWVARFVSAGSSPIDTPAPDMSNGVYVQAGTTAHDIAFMIERAVGGVQYFQVNGDGSGFLGPSNANNISWSPTGAFTIGGTPLTRGARAAPTQTMSIITRPVAATQAGAWLQDIGGKSAGISTPSAPGLDNGLCISGGTNSSDAALYVMNSSGARDFMRIKGDGSGYLSADQASQAGLTWDAQSTFHFTSTNQSLSAVNFVSPPKTEPGIYLWSIGGGAPSGSSLGCSNGLYIAAGTNGQDFALRVVDDAETTGLFNLKGDGSGGLFQLNWDNRGVYHFGPTGSPTGEVITVRNAPHSIAGLWFFQIGGGPSGSTVGCSNGLYVGAGTNATDMAFWVQNDHSDTDFLRIHGDGSIYMPSLPTTANAANLYIDPNGRLMVSTVGGASAEIEPETKHKARATIRRHGRHAAERVMVLLQELLGEPA